MLSPATLNNDTVVAGWLDIFKYSNGRKVSSGQADIDFTADRHPVLRTIKVACRIIAFTDDLICPPHLCAEASKVIPDCDFTEIRACGHLGYLEQPEEVNRAIIEFLEKY
jgi:pimeloyl-ACP methyl ester carboxylesterase